MGYARSTVLVVLPAVLVFAAAPAVPAYAAGVSCAAAGGVVSLDVDLPGGTTVVDRLPTGEIRADGVQCGDATAGTTDTVAVHVAAGTVVLDLAQAFAPGLTAETDGISEIEVAWTGGGTLVVAGGAGDDDLRYAAGGLHLNGDTDVDVTFAGAAPAVTFQGNDGSDYLDASGAPATAAVTVDGGAGDDILRGHAGAGVLAGGAGADDITDGGGHDTVTGGDGDDRVFAGRALMRDSARPVAVPDSGFVTDSISVADLPRGYDLEVRVTVAHPDVSTLVVKFGRGSGSLPLAWRSPGTGFSGTLFDDSAAVPVEEGSGVRTGRFRPWTGAVSSYGFGATQYPYQLTVQDVVADGQAATLVGWSLHIVTGHGADGADSYDGGAGRDELSYTSRTGAITLDTRAEWGPAGEAGEGDTVRFPTFESYVTGSGDDTLRGSSRDEVLDTGYGSDTLRGGGGTDSYLCGNTDLGDVASFEDATTGLTIDLTERTVTGAGLGTGVIDDCETVYGTAYNDVINGSYWNDLLWGLGGHDRIKSRGGFDTVHGGAGDDLIDESEGWGREHDVISGDAGTDRLTYAGRGGPVVVGFDGPVDRPREYVDRDDVTGVEHLTGSEGADVLVGDAGFNDIVGGGGNDLIEGGGGDDWLYGGDGDDHITGGAGNDRLFGQAGKDMFVEGSENTGDDDISGGAGLDLADYGRRLLPLTISLDDLPGDGEAGENDNVHMDVENLWGGQLGDTFTGSWVANELWGFGGEDVLTGGPGVDLLQGGVGNDVLFAQDATPEAVHGGDGVDVAYRDALDDLYGVEVALPL